jgi:flagellar FliL protein
MSKNLMFLVMGVFLLVVIIMGVGFFALWSKISSFDQAMSPQSADKSEELAKEDTKEYVKRPTYLMDTFIVNLSDPKGKRYLRVTMDLEMSKEEFREEIEMRVPQIRNAILMILPARTVEGVQSIEGKIALRDEIITEVNNILSNGSITNLYFTEFVVQ